jgi:hypothetical protein
LLIAAGDTLIATLAERQSFSISNQQSAISNQQSAVRIPPLGI